ncbi:MAG: NAD(P)H-dependent oxidoreductase subunit E, partial [Bacteroidales bacterium]|nr:NAD(P)H-dependent oxidoreductase subunit E [Bacteroidales bacterium]
MHIVFTAISARKLLEDIKAGKCQFHAIEIMACPGELINVLHQTQDFLGYLPAEVQELIAECLHIPTAKVYGVVSFYAFF